MTSNALKSIVNSPTVKGKAAAKTAGMHDIGGVPKVDLRDNAMPKDIMVTPRISKMYLIINFLSILKPFPFIIHLNLTRFQYLKFFKGQ